MRDGLAGRGRLGIPFAFGTERMMEVRAFPWVLGILCILHLHTVMPFLNKRTFPVLSITLRYLKVIQLGQGVIISHPDIAA